MVTLLVRVPLSTLLYVAARPGAGDRGARPVAGRGCGPAGLAADRLRARRLRARVPGASRCWRRWPRSRCPAWFLYEVTVANMGSVSDDRSTGLRRWLLVAIPVLDLGHAGARLAGALLGMGRDRHRSPVPVSGVRGVRVRRRAARALAPRTRALGPRGHRPLRRFFGPGILRAATLLFARRRTRSAAVSRRR